ncbi:hypothetical protein BU16DRAFT_522460 [Lophium mytilinum]|uniref:Uncharacterized protein n=1 Tax=Lophium mytilinum TaxID=390894 RepID=A0A6A6RAM1_9PEZI|nr:hypothetical protein BU16DRAFT_522460 [Lophium mytilinum]
MSRLLLLPRELRDDIIKLVINSYSPPPRNPHDPFGQAKLKRHLDCTYHKAPWSGSCILYDPRSHDYLPNCSALLQTNWKLHHETMERLNKLRPNFALDIMVVDNTQLWPKWTSIPMVSSHVETVTAHIRTFRTEAGWQGFLGGPGEPPSMTWAFYDILKRFLNIGPVGPGYSVNEIGRGTTIQTLQIDVVCPKDLPEGTEVAPEQSGAQIYFPGHIPFVEGFLYDEKKKYLMHPKSLARFLWCWLEALLHMDRYSAIHGAILFERVGTIRLMVDGELFKEWNLATLLAAFPLDGPPQTFERGTEADFKSWREETYVFRKQAGLPVIRHGSAQGS